MVINGILTALITPFLNDGKVDWKSLKNLLLFQENSDVDGVVLLGTTGEECALEENECKKIIQLAIECLHTKKIFVGISGNCTQKVINRLMEYEKFDISGYLIGCPYYNKPTSSGLVQHFSMIAASTQKPIILYNIPSRCGVKITFDVLEKLKYISNIVAIKEASGDINYATKMIEKFSDRYSILSGNDNMLLPMLACGARGCISVVSNILPSVPTQIYRNFQYDLPRATEIHNLTLNFVNSLFIETNPMCIKYIMSKNKMCKNVLRSPLVKVGKTTGQTLTKEFNKLQNYSICSESFAEFCRLLLN